MTAPVPDEDLFRKQMNALARGVAELFVAQVGDVISTALRIDRADLCEQVQALFHPVGRTIEEDAYNDAVRDVLALLDGGES